MSDLLVKQNFKTLTKTNLGQNDIALYQIRHNNRDYNQVNVSIRISKEKTENNLNFDDKYILDS